MGVIIFEITAVVLVVSLLAFVAWDDYKTRKLRAEEDRLKALEEARRERARAQIEGE